MTQLNATTNRTEMQPQKKILAGARGAQDGQIMAPNAWIDDLLFLVGKMRRIDLWISCVSCKVHFLHMCIRCYNVRVNSECSKIQIFCHLMIKLVQWKVSICRGAALTDISIEEVEKDGKYVRIINRSASKVPFNMSIANSVKEVVVWMM